MSCFSSGIPDDWNIYISYRGIKIPLAIVKNFSENRAAKYLDRLGFKNGFKTAFLKQYPAGWRRFQSTALMRTNSATMRNWFTAWFEVITNVSSARLRRILVPDEEASRKWQERLTTCNKRWCDLKVPEDTLIRITQEWLLETFDYGVRKDAIRQRYRRFKTERVI
jgi:hypothetical protein